MDSVLGAMVVVYWVGFLVAIPVLRIRAGTGFWHRLKIFGPGGFGPVWVATMVVCAMFWPLTLAVWLARGRPEPRVVFNDRASERQARPAAGGSR